METNRFVCFGQNVLTFSVTIRVNTHCSYLLPCIISARQAQQADTDA